MHACFDRGDAGGAAQAQRRLNVWAKKREVRRVLAGRPSFLMSSPRGCVTLLFFA